MTILSSFVTVVLSLFVLSLPILVLSPVTNGYVQQESDRGRPSADQCDFSSETKSPQLHYVHTYLRAQALNIATKIV